MVSVRDLKVHFRLAPSLLTGRGGGWIRAVDGVTFDVERGETLGLVGESGSGKTTLGLAILQLHRATTGSVEFEGQELTRLRPEQIRPLRRKMQMIFQNPIGSLDPRMTVQEIVEEPMVILGVGTPRSRKERVRELLSLVSLEPYLAARYPHEFSGGQCQRIGIARALAVQPEFLVLDEPVSALDVSIQAQIINLLADLRREFNLTYLFIAHNLAVVRHISHRIAVMYAGKMVEVAPREELYGTPLHPYTRALLAAVPVPDPVVEEQRTQPELRGEIPSPLAPPPGCRFHPRCPMAIPECALAEPPLEEKVSGHWAACIRV
ncbi:MAG: ABC transporter ATP-binding protein [Chloroflexi bacterium]|nr:ABC transporter ATP-binding protein [Chloroflexota bacterium]